VSADAAPRTARAEAWSPLDPPPTDGAETFPSRDVAPEVRPGEPGQPATEPREPPNVERRVRLATTIVAPTTALTALLFYYGYVWLNGYYAFFGLDLGSLRLSMHDMLVNSVAPLWPPATAILVLAILGLSGHERLVRRLDERGWDAAMGRGVALLTLTAAACLLRGVAGIVVPTIAMQEAIGVTPLTFGAGVAGLTYASELRRRYRDDVPATTWTRSLSLVGAVGLAALSLFWATNSFAFAHGQAAADRDADQLWWRFPAVVLHSVDRIHLDYLPGADESEIPAPEAGPYRFRYEGLRLLVAANDRLFLLPVEWDREHGATLIVVDDDRIQRIVYDAMRPSS
jgi:hypothetical protein